MEIKKLEIIETKNINVKINISLDEDSIKVITSYSFTCLNCQGYGCRDNSCNDGTISIPLNFSQLNDVFSSKEAQKIRDSLFKLLQSNKDSITV